jgi:hypothetical protein
MAANPDKMPSMLAIQFLSVPVSTRSVRGCGTAPRGFSIIINVTAEKLPYLDWGCGDPRGFPVILTATAGKLPYGTYRPGTT